ncbi:hypothetical protein [Phenylobacterium soli]|uniref:hypothetical protein n=1 Tax=Phenylobacterium soli TaxID=2170551 RepID=UPI001403C1F4|nr:hypothetical protein [Phenylobacterium soli]
MNTPRVYELRVLKRAGAWRSHELVCTPAEVMIEAQRLRREPGARVVEVRHAGEHLYALG